MDRARIVETEDGSHTVISPQFGEAYHSKYGAIQESRHVFLQAGLHPLLHKKEEIAILEIGFGTGLNALLTWLGTKEQPVNVHYDALEAYPIPKETVENLNYPDILDVEINIWNKLHSFSWGSAILLADNFRLVKHRVLFQKFRSARLYDLIYFDAFAPEAQPELWDIPMMRSMYNCLHFDGVLVTYCAKGYVKRNLKSVGFTVESIPGPPGKREMTRAIKMKMNE